MKTTIKILLASFILFASYSCSEPKGANDGDFTENNDGDELVIEDGDDNDTDIDNSNNDDNEGNSSDNSNNNNDGGSDPNTDNDNGNDDNGVTDNNNNENDADKTDVEIVLSLVNSARTDAGLNELVLNDKLNLAAFLHSQDMDENDYFNTIGLNGERFWHRTQNVNYEGDPRAENICRGALTAEVAFEKWMNNPTDKANILGNGISEMGLGRSGDLWTQILGDF